MMNWYNIKVTIVAAVIPPFIPVMFFIYNY